MATLAIRPAKLDDFPEIVRLLDQSDLPPDGLADHLATTQVVCHAGRVVGCVALELHGELALLRSLAVDESWRGRGLGQRLTRSALDLARNQGVATVYLLTETADGFFPRFGFRPITRDEVVGAVRESVEFTTACPESARVMVLHSHSSGTADERG